MGKYVSLKGMEFVEREKRLEVSKVVWEKLVEKKANTVWNYLNVYGEINKKGIVKCNYKIGFCNLDNITKNWIEKYLEEENVKFNFKVYDKINKNYCGDLMLYFDYKKVK